MFPYTQFQGNQINELTRRAHLMRLGCVKPESRNSGLRCPALVRGAGTKTCLGPRMHQTRAACLASNSQDFNNVRLVGHVAFDVKLLA